MSLSRNSTPTTTTTMMSPINTNRQRRAAALNSTAVPRAAAARKKQARATAATHAAAGDDASMDDVSSSSGDTGDSGDSSMGDVPAAVVVLPDASRKEMLENGRHFSKIASRFALENTTPGYNSWVIQFKAELENYGLEHALSEPLQADSPLSVLLHKVVYNMIVSCVPKSVLTTITVNLKEHSACAAWRVLRCQFIGDESTYLQGLETRFQRDLVRW